MREREEEEEEEEEKRRSGRGEVVECGGCQVPRLFEACSENALVRRRVLEMRLRLPELLERRGLTVAAYHTHRHSRREDPRPRRLAAVSARRCAVLSSVGTAAARGAAGRQRLVAARLVAGGRDAAARAGEARRLRSHLSAAALATAATVCMRVRGGRGRAQRRRPQRTGPQSRHVHMDGWRDTGRARRVPPERQR